MIDNAEHRESSGRSLVWSYARRGAVLGLLIAVIILLRAYSVAAPHGCGDTYLWLQAWLLIWGIPMSLLPAIVGEFGGPSLMLPLIPEVLVVVLVANWAFLGWLLGVVVVKVTIARQTKRGTGLGSNPTGEDV
jgi:hypothetical protein